MARETAISAANVEARRRVRNRLRMDRVEDDIGSFNLGFFPWSRRLGFEDGRDAQEIVVGRAFCAGPFLSIARRLWLRRGDGN